jgi:hypothetical protein
MNLGLVSGQDVWRVQALAAGVCRYKSVKVDGGSRQRGKLSWVLKK